MMTPTKLYRFAIKLVLTGFVLVFGLLLKPTSAQAAAANPTGTFMTSTNDFYAYVQTGENLDASFIKQIDGSGVNDDDAVITVSRPGAADSTCTVLAADPVSTACTFINQTATSTGVWHIQFAHTAATPHDFYSWSIDVQAGSTDIPGRIWSKLYNMAQQGGSPPTGIDFSVWFQSQFGYLYKTSYFDYNGIESAIQAGGLGLVKSGGGCIPLYKSVNRNDTSFDLAPAGCDSDFKLFYEAPAADLPASATDWDATTDWIKPAIANPAISNLAFAPTTANSRDGNVTFNLANFTGLVDLDIDTNGNGSYSDPGDVSIETGAASGAVTIPFDGKDGNGDAIPNSQKLNFKVTIDHTAEIHFLATDVELRGGGIEVDRLNGPGGNLNTIFWDDTNFASPDANRCSLTSQLDGTAGVDSTGGVHAWSLSGCTGPQFGNFNDNVHGSWGDSRIINEWAFVPANDFAAISLAGFTDPGTPTLPDTGQNSYALLGLAGLLIVGSAVGLVSLKRQLLK